jgi:cytochrome c556
MPKRTIFAAFFIAVVSLAMAAAERDARSDQMPAGETAIKMRQEILKGFGDAAKPVGAMLKGEQSFDLALVQKALQTYVRGTEQLPKLYPDDSKTGHKTEALPRIWEEKPRFESLYGKLHDDAAAAVVAIKDEASFKANMGKVFGDCKACHDDFRQKK